MAQIFIVRRTATSELAQGAVTCQSQLRHEVHISLRALELRLEDNIGRWGLGLGLQGEGREQG